MIPHRNKERLAAWVSVAVGLAGLLMVVLPGLLGMDGMDGGYALGFVGAFLALSGLVVALLFHRRAQQLERIIGQAEYLAHWRYEPAEWRRFVADEYERQIVTNRTTWLLIAAISAVVGLVFLLIDRESGWIVLAALTGLLLVLAVVALFAPYLARARRAEQPGEVWLAKTGVVLNDTFTGWSVFGARLESASWHAGAPTYMQFDISYPGRYGRVTSSVRVPVPENCEQEARQALHALVRV
ncbi:MAG: hypothetical protein ACYC4R_12245 [Anaerolineae bacterium]